MNNYLETATILCTTYLDHVIVEFNMQVETVVVRRQVVSVTYMDLSVYGLAACHWYLNCEHQIQTVGNKLYLDNYRNQGSRGSI